MPGKGKQRVLEQRSECLEKVRDKSVCGKILSMDRRGEEEAKKIWDAEEVDRIHQEEAETTQPVSKSSPMAAGEVGMSVQHRVG